MQLLILEPYFPSNKLILYNKIEIKSLASKFEFKINKNE